MNIKKIFYTFLIFCTLALNLSPFFAQEASASINKQIHYQGVLRTLAGALVTDTSYNIIFKLYTASSGGSAIWTGTYTSGNGNALSTTNGVFSVLLGSGTGNTLAGVDFNQDTLYIGITVGTDSEMTPRQRMGTAATAINSSLLNGLNSDQFLRSDASNATSTATTFLSVVQNGAGKIAEFFGPSSVSVLSILSGGNIGIGTTTPYARLSVEGSSVLGNSATAGYFIATTSTASIFPYASTTALTVSGTASTTNLTISGISGCSGSSALTTNSSGVVACGSISGGGGAFPFTPLTNFGVNTSATTTALWAQNGIFASSTSQFSYASSTALTISGTAYIGTLNGPLQANAGLVSATSSVGALYGGTGLTTLAQGDIIFGSAANTYSALTKSGNANSFLKNSGTSNNPAWSTIASTDLSNTANIVLLNNTQTISGAKTFSAATIFSSTISAVTSATISAANTSSVATLSVTGGSVDGSSIINLTGGGVTGSSIGFDGSNLNIIATGSGLQVNSSTSYFSGNVGIGTTSPYAKLSVVGQVVGAYFTATTSDASVFPYASTTALSSSGSAFFATGGGKVSVGATTTPWAQLSINADGNTGPSFAIGSSTATHLVVTNAGNVGIGTVAPSALLHISGTGSNVIAKIGDYFSYRNDGVMLWGNGTANGVLTWDTSAAVVGAQSGKSLVFTVGSNSGSLSSERMRIDTSGNVGLGTTSPLARLDVAGANNGTVPIFQVSSVASFATTTRLIVDSSGNVGIGNASPTEKLTVAGNILSTGTTTTATLDFGQFKQRRVVIEGDSISDTMTAGSGDWPAYLASSSPYFKFATTTNYAVSGQTVATMVGQYATEARLSRPTLAGDDNWFFLYAGINDFSSCGTTASGVYSDLKSEWASAKADGYKVVAFTLFYSTAWDGIDCLDGHGTVAPRDWKLDALNNLIRSDASLYDYLVDTATVLNPRTDASDFSDGTHPNAQGAQIIADTIGRTIEKVSPYLLSSAMSTTTAPTSWNMQLNPTGGVSVGTSTIVASTSLFTISATSSRTYALNVLTSTAGSALTVLSTGNVGIGTSSPYAKLSVVGQVVGAYFTATTSTASTFPYASTTALTVSGTAFIDTASTTNLTISGISGCSGTSALTTNSSGVVACGAITVGSAFPFTPTTNFGVNTSATTTAIWARGGIFASSTSYFPLGTWNTNGNVAIGTTTAPGLTGALLSIEASTTDVITTNIKVATSSSISLYNPAVAQVGVGSIVSFDTNFSGGRTTRAYIKGGSELFSGNAGGFLSFGTNIAGQSNSMNEAMRIDRFQNVGIGSTTPWGLLSVNANGLTSSVGAPQFVVGSSTATNFIVANGGNVGVGTTSPFAKFSVVGAGVFYSSGSGVASTFTVGAPNGSNGSATLNISGSTNSSINPGGDATINFKTGNSGATVSSSILYDGSDFSVNGADSISLNTATNISGAFSSGDTVSFPLLTVAIGGNALCVDAGGNVQNAGASTCAASALRFKQNIVDLSASDTFSKLMKLRAVSFDYKDGFHDTNEGAGSYGLIAEEVEKIDPLLVDYCKDGQVCTLHFEKFTGLFLKAIQEMYTTVDRLVTTVADIAQKIAGFADIFTTKKLCVEDVCVTKDQFQKLINNSNNNTNTGGGGGGGGSNGDGNGGSGGGTGGGDNGSGKDTSTTSDTSIDTSIGGSTSSGGDTGTSDTTTSTTTDGAGAGAGADGSAGAGAGAGSGDTSAPAGGGSDAGSSSVGDAGGDTGGNAGGAGTN